MYSINKKGWDTQTSPHKILIIPLYPRYYSPFFPHPLAKKPPKMAIKMAIKEE